MTIYILEKIAIDLQNVNNFIAFSIKIDGYIELEKTCSKP